VQDYCDHAFGPASEAMQAFMRTVDDALKAADHITDGVWTWMTPEAMAQAREHLDAAHAAAANADEKVRARLRTWEIGFRYGEIGVEAWRTGQRGLAESDRALLQRAIELANEAAEYLAAENREGPHYAAATGKLITVHRTQWERALARLQEQ